MSAIDMANALSVTTTGLTEDDSNAKFNVWKPTFNACCHLIIGKLHSVLKKLGKLQNEKVNMALKDDDMETEDTDFAGVNLSEVGKDGQDAPEVKDESLDDPNLKAIHEDSEDMCRKQCLVFLCTSWCEQRTFHMFVNHYEDILYYYILEFVCTTLSLFVLGSSRQLKLSS